MCATLPVKHTAVRLRVFAFYRLSVSCTECAGMLCDTLIILVYQGHTLGFTVTCMTIELHIEVVQ